MIQMKRTQIFSDYDKRLNFYVDNNATALNGLLVEMPATGMTGMLVHDVRRQGLTFEQLWSRAMCAAEVLRSQPHVRIYPESVFIPFVEITAVGVARECAKLDLMVNMGIGYAFPDQRVDLRACEPSDHMRRVTALAKAADALARFPKPLS